MTDDKIKEEFEKYSNEVDWEQTYDDYESVYRAGFRAAERLAKIEVLEELQSFYRCNDPEQWELASWVESTISDLKAGQ